MRCPKIVFRSVVVLLLVAVIAAIWLFTADLGFLKPRIESWVADRVQRQLLIEDLELRLGSHLRVVAEGVRLADADWSSETLMLEIGRLEVAVDLLSALSGPLQVESVSLKGARLDLIESRSGRRNWDFSAVDRIEDDRSDSDGLAIVLQQIEAEDVGIRFTSPHRETVNVRIETLRQMLRPDGYLDFMLDGIVNARNISGKGSVGTWETLLDGENIEYQVDGRLDTVVFATSGEIDDLANPRRPTGRLSLSGPDVNDLMRLLGLPGEGAGDIDVEGSLLPSDAGPLVLKLGGNIGATTIEAAATFSDLQALEQAEVRLDASGPNLGRILALVGIDEVGEAPFTLALDAERLGPELVIKEATMNFGEARFELAGRLSSFPSLDGGTLDLIVRGEDLGRLRGLIDLPGVATGPFSLEMALHTSAEGEESIRLDLATTLVQLEADGTLGAPPRHLGSRFSIRATSRSAERLGRAWGIDKLPDAPLHITGTAELGDGALALREPLTVTLDGIAARIEGRVQLESGLRGSELTFDLRGPDVAALLEAIDADAALPRQPYAIDGRVRVEDDGLRLSEVNAEVGTASVVVRGFLSLRPGLVGSDLAVSSMGPALEEFTAPIDRFAIEPGPFELSGRVVRDDRALDLRDVQLRRERGRLALDLTLDLPLESRRARYSLRASGPDIRAFGGEIMGFEPDASGFDVDVRGELRDRLWSIDRLEFRVGENLVSARGELDFGGEGAATQFSLEAAVPGLASLGSVEGRRFRDQPASVSVRVSGGNGFLQIEDLAARIGESAAHGNARYRFAPVPEIDVELRADRLVLTPLFEAEEEPSETATSAAEPDDGRMIPDVEIPFAVLRKLNGSLDLRVDELEGDRLRLKDLRLAADLGDGVLSVSELVATAPSGRLGASASLDAHDDVGALTLALQAEDLAFGIRPTNQDLSMTSDIAVHLGSTGRNLRALAANANGAVLIDVRGGRVDKNRLASLFYGDLIDEILSTISPFFESEEFTSIECIILPYEVSDGVVKSAPNSYILTDKVSMLVEGNVDLETEALSVNVRTRPRKSIGISAAEIINPYVKIVGTLSTPRLAVDEKGVLITGGAAVATGGLSILARLALDRLAKSPDPCGDALNRGREALVGRLPGLQVPSD